MAGESAWVAPGPSIYGFIRSRLNASGRLDQAGAALPDEAKVVAGGGIRWVAGGLDGAVGHHAGGGEAAARADRTGDLFVKAASRATGRRLKKLYAAVSDDSALGYIDPLIERLVQLKPDVARLHGLGRWLATTAPDRGAVKVGLAILGVTGVGDELTVVRTLGAHDEFTLYAAVAIRNGMPEPDRELWALAQVVDGWGRIQCVERLADTEDREIRSWILREGFRNSVMYEYLAYIAATTGDLAAALKGPDVDRELLTAAGQVLSALVMGGPAEDLDDYEQGATAVEAFIGHMTSRADTLDDFHAVAAIEWFLTQDEGWEPRAERGWTPPLRRKLLTQCSEILNRGEWTDKVTDALRSEDRVTFWSADQAARKLGIDTFDLHFERVRKDPFDGPWYQAWQQADEERVRRLVALARQTLPLDDIGTGPGDDYEIGPERRAHRALDWTLQALREHPGLGGDLLLVGLRSPVTRNRNMALAALKEWPGQTWPPGAQAAVEDLASADPNEKTRELAQETRTTR